MSEYFISINDLKKRIGTPDCPMILDVRRRAAFEAADTILPTARWRDHTTYDAWAQDIPDDADVVVYCVHAHNVSQCAAAGLRARGINARTLEGGIEGWRQAGGPVIARTVLPERNAAAAQTPTTWVTGLRPQIDVMACAWLIRRFVDREARFLFVEPEQVRPVGDEIGGVTFGIADGAQMGAHGGAPYTFDTLLRQAALNDPSLDAIATIIRASLTAHHAATAEPSSEIAGLAAIWSGVSGLSDGDDHAAVGRGMTVCDALYAWQKQRQPDMQGGPLNRSAPFSERHAS